MADDLNKIRAVKSQYEKNWMALQGVVAIGIGLAKSGQAGIIISVAYDVQTFREMIPEEIDGVKIELQESGEIVAFNI